MRPANTHLLILFLFLVCRIGKLLHCEQIPGSWPAVDRDAVASTEEIEEQFDTIVEANDQLLERVVRERMSIHTHTCVCAKASKREKDSQLL